jgi:hypothetical protein
VYVHIGITYTQGQSFGAIERRSKEVDIVQNIRLRFSGVLSGYELEQGLRLMNLIDH